MLSIFLLIPLSLMLFVVAIWAVRYAVKSNQFEDLDNASQLIILEDRQERRQTIQAHDNAKASAENTKHEFNSDDSNNQQVNSAEVDATLITNRSTNHNTDSDDNPNI
ncbi:cbb3-type cytochrome oxidase assembly protein CcoS [Psychrobacter sp. LV10R520-6]|uniref:cbb3-type cytochrome oxidase assembly protein CcoS n=1 Tax=Psychrobacter sp. LV10R520-6 TaxID=1415574 RepID=UPI0024C668F2|nr:cbb3-type cytochrome oxidase assembly protein CcoS [Psychrobacter sp. LV10R520-6]SNT69732.1 cytochrome oxidase maturation protein, cbb3-type [Psychrobacter sp. LV10R520-6]